MTTIADSYTPGDYLYVDTLGTRVGITVRVLGERSEAVELDVTTAKVLRRVLKAAIKEIENR
jgi:hypothetical protein